ncbi:hypothetical protein DL98DRAFT_508461 [Cadophora sp. DSE1049]|nr:hypothetical protein DL98DRAFT_508461 [Cadophora sp. DSE1049]
MTEKENIEPIWIKTSPPYSVLPSPEDNDQSGGISTSQDSLLDAPLDPMYALQTPLLAQPPRVPLDNQSILPPWITGFQTMQQQQFSQPMVPLGFLTPYGGFGFQPNVIPNPMLSPGWYPAPMVQLLHGYDGGHRLVTTVLLCVSSYARIQAPMTSFRTSLELCGTLETGVSSGSIKSSRVGCFLSS